MGRNSGGTNNYAKATGSGTIAVTSNGRKLTAKQMAKVSASAESIDSLPHREVVKQLNKAISRYEKVMGVRERTIKVANLSGAYGVTYISSNGSQGVYLSKSFFSLHRNKIEGDYRAKNYATGFKNKTNRPRILVNRNPTINHAGIILMDIRKIHDDPNDYTLHLPPDVLESYGADFNHHRSGIGSNPSKEHCGERLTSGVRDLDLAG